MPLFAPGGSGNTWTVHVPAASVSATGTSKPLEFTTNPTASHQPELGQDIEYSAPPLFGDGVGSVALVQVVPASVASMNPVVPVDP
ncbi:MAG TPA: hypothetical protein VHT75_19510 [Acidimicrobiales bacterium]|jgi:hypothetical protein|nr:hypothetical protein [Acidimicrobiales bacterium]